MQDQNEVTTPSELKADENLSSIPEAKSPNGTFPNQNARQSEHQQRQEQPQFKTNESNWQSHNRKLHQMQKAAQRQIEHQAAAQRQQQNQAAAQRLLREQQRERVERLPTELNADENLSSVPEAKSTNGAFSNQNARQQSEQQQRQEQQFKTYENSWQSRNRKMQEMQAAQKRQQLTNLAAAQRKMREQQREIVERLPMQKAIARAAQEVALAIETLRQHRVAVSALEQACEAASLYAQQQKKAGLHVATPASIEAAAARLSAAYQLVTEAEERVKTAKILHANQEEVLEQFDITRAEKKAVAAERKMKIP